MEGILEKRILLICMLGLSVAELAYTPQSYGIWLDHSRNLREMNGMIHLRYNQKVRVPTIENDRQLTLASLS